MSNSCISKSLSPWLDTRSAGLLLHPSSLPGSQGIGGLGAEARSFVDFLETAGFSYWQTCPLGPTGFGDSPYQVFCSNAGNPYFIDWKPLQEIGLLSETDLLPLLELPADSVDYGVLYEVFFPLARIAYSNFKLNRNGLELKYGSFDSFKKNILGFNLLHVFRP
jgi:4-alpha-glucanotransferase